MFTVAVIGPDGAGKTTICQRLEQTLLLPSKYIYMGGNPEASKFALPTTRLIWAIKRARGAPAGTGAPPPPGSMKARRKGVLKRAGSSLKSWLWLVNRLGEEWYRQGLAWFYQSQGQIVLFDRHFFADYQAYVLANSSRGLSLVSRIHGFLLERVYPKPDLVIYLDAPAALLFARKGESTIEVLERWRQAYLQMRHSVQPFVIVDASQPVDAVARDVSKGIWEFHRARTGSSTTMQDDRG
jgi:thymidylate kinase